jgi:ABC-type sugar transport system ATPase subunit
MSESVALHMRGINKRYPGVKALQGVDFSAFSGQVMGLVGENGAGKSTLLKILAGAVSADSGTVELDGKSVVLNSPLAAKKLGISVIYQELNLARHLSVAENLFVGKEPRTSLGLVDFKTMHRVGQKILDDMKLNISSKAIVGSLNIALRQMVEIAKALLDNARIVVMDEPTSSLTEEETATLFRIIRELKEKGVCVIYVSHRMREVFDICDRITILRDGKLVDVIKANETAPSDIVRLMVGRDLSDLFGRRTIEIDPNSAPILEVTKLCSGKQVKEVSFDVKPGEIVALSGLIGSGRSEAAMAIFGARRIDSGEIKLSGHKVDFKRPQHAIQRGIALVPEDRKQQGLFLQLSVRQNMSSASLDEISGFAIISNKRDKKLATDYSEALSLRQTAREVAVGTLSGGNQQKVVLGRWLAKKPNVLILDEPTRGVDVGAKGEIYQIIRRIAAEGVGIVMISSELTEVLGMADRIVVMREGKKVAELPAEGTTEAKVIALATGVEEHQS